MFPDNVVATLKPLLKTRLDEFPIQEFDAFSKQMKLLEPSFFTRPLRADDPNRSIGIYSFDWTPNQQTQEMGWPGETGPTITRYGYRIQTLTRYAIEEEQRADASIDAKVIRAILARDPAIRVALTALSDVAVGVREQLTRYGVSRQRFFNNELRGSFLGLCLTEFWVDTQTSPA